MSKCCTYSIDTMRSVRFCSSPYTVPFDPGQYRYRQTQMIYEHSRIYFILRRTLVVTFEVSCDMCDHRVELMLPSLSLVRRVR